MSTEAEYRGKAEECRQRAAQAVMSGDKAEWLRLPSSGRSWPRAQRLRGNEACQSLGRDRVNLEPPAIALR